MWVCSVLVVCLDVCASVYVCVHTYGQYLPSWVARLCRSWLSLGVGGGDPNFPRKELQIGTFQDH